MKYYLYHAVCTETHITYHEQQTFADKSQLIEFLSCYQGDKPYYDSDLHKIVYNNRYLDEINMTGTDTMKSFQNFNPVYYIRPYMFMNDNGNVVDTRCMIKDIMAQSTKESVYPYFIHYQSKHRKRQYRKHHTITDFRHIKYKHIVAYKSDNEYTEYIRKKYANCIDRYPEKMRRISGSWKDQTKRPHQWKTKTEGHKNPSV